MSWWRGLEIWLPSSIMMDICTITLFGIGRALLVILTIFLPGLKKQVALLHEVAIQSTSSKLGALGAHTCFVPYFKVWNCGLIREPDCLWLLSY
jgi:hypothetical protein